jgi:hypothetical protein
LGRERKPREVMRMRAVQERPHLLLDAAEMFFLHAIEVQLIVPVNEQNGGDDLTH